MAIPFFSIVMPVYNVEKYLQESLDSLIRQEFRDWEAICVDDGSTDGSGRILDAFAARDARIRVIHKQNGGTSTARNAALDVARGKWIGFLDGDDLIASDWLIAANEMAARHPDVEWMMQGFVYFKDDIVPSGHRVGRSQVEYRVLTGREVLYAGWPEVTDMGFSCRNFYRRDVVGDMRCPVGIRWMQDMYFTLRMLPRFQHAVWSTLDGYYYRKRRGSSCISPKRLDDPPKNFSELRKIWIEQYPLLRAAPDLKVIQKAVAYYAIYDVLGPWLFAFGKDHPVECRALAALLRELHRIDCFKPYLLPRGFKYCTMVWIFMLIGKWIKKVRRDSEEIQN